VSVESIIGAIAVLAVVIFVHELGHFLVAKWCRVEVLVFSMGFGPTIFSRKIGETTYRLALVPFGGYVKMAGQEEDGGEAPSDPARGFSGKPLRHRAAIVAAGPAVNLVFAFVVMFVAYFAYGQLVPSSAARIGGVVIGSPADKAGLKTGEEVVSVDGTPVAGWDDFSTRVRESGGKTLAIALRDDSGQARQVDVTPAVAPNQDAFGEVVGESYMIGIQRHFDHEAAGLFESVSLAGQSTYRMSVMIFVMLGRIVQGRVNASDLGGPIMIAQEAGRLAETGLEPLLRFIALISVNLGILNILPIPVLDGGHLFFFLIEGLRGRPLSIRVREMAQQVGVLLLVALMVFVVFNDISRIVAG
jgi:regulator of sigma E protease